MAAGDIKFGSATIAAGTTSTIDIKPTLAGEYWKIHNIRCTGPVAFQIVSGASVVEYDPNDTTASSRESYVYHITDTHFVRLRNLHATNTVEVAYDGVFAK